MAELRSRAGTHLREPFREGGGRGLAAVYYAEYPAVELRIIGMTEPSRGCRG